MNKILLLSFMLLTALACKKSSSEPEPPPPPAALRLLDATLNGAGGSSHQMVNLTPLMRYNFSDKVDKSTATAALNFTDVNGNAIPYDLTWERNDSSMLLQPKAGTLKGLAKYTVILDTKLKSAGGGALQSGFTFQFTTQIDSTPKFPAISEDSLLTLIQKQTFKYFWDFAHPVSGLARERNTSGDLVTSGGSGFGIMAIVTAIHRGFISRQQGLQRLQTITTFLRTKAQRFKGAFPHWLNGITGEVIPFSAQDNGADLVETSFLAMGLITARQYFDGSNTEETTLRNDINTIVNGIEWSWFRKNDEQVLYWHWSPNLGFAMNLPIRGWNECLVTYVMAASSTTSTIPKTVYEQGFGRSGAMKNGKTFYGQVLPLGEDYGGPLFLSHYSFLGIDPNGLTDQYANYWSQQVSHSLINYEHCKANPKGWAGYSKLCWGLTASDIQGGYTASSPTNDVGVIAPTAAISALPYAPQQSMDAIKFFYYTLGDKLWKDYGFIDAFSISQLWFASSFLAIDQGPQIIMIENYRSGLLWKLFTSAPEIKAGMKKLGFAAPYL